MGKLAEAYVDIVPNIAPLERGLTQAKVHLTGFVSEGNRTLSGLRLNFGGLALAGGGAIGMGLFKAANMAADLGETVDKVKMTFGKSAKDMIAQADDLASKYGVVKKETLDAAAAFGLMGRAAGLSTEKSAELGQSFVKLGLDLASYHDLTNAEAFTKLRAGLAGEAEPLRPLGIMLSEDAVKAEAMAMGLVKVKRELTDQEKILARISLIQKQAAPSLDNLALTSGSAKNQMKALQGEITNMTTEFGEKLLPALVSGIGLIREVGNSIKGAFGTGPIDMFTSGLKDFIDQTREANKDLVVIGERISSAWKWVNTPIPEMLSGPEWAGESSKWNDKEWVASKAAAEAESKKLSMEDTIQMEKTARKVTENLAKFAISLPPGVSAVTDLALTVTNVNDYLKRQALLVGREAALEAIYHNEPVGRDAGIDLQVRSRASQMRWGLEAISELLLHPGGGIGFVPGRDENPAPGAIEKAFGPIAGLFARGIAGLTERRFENLGISGPAPRMEASQLAAYQQQQELEGGGMRAQTEELKKANAKLEDVKAAINFLGDALKHGARAVLPR